MNSAYSVQIVFIFEFLFPSTVLFFYVDLSIQTVLHFYSLVFNLMFCLYIFTCTIAL